MNLMKNILIGDYESFLDEKRYKVFFVTNLFLILGIVIHLFYAGIFTYFDTELMILVELFSVSVLSVAVFMNHKKVRHVPALIMCAEIGVNGVLWALVMKSGYNHYLFTFVALLAAFLFLDVGKKQRLALTVFLLICLNISNSSEVSNISIAVYENKDWLAYFSLNMVFVILTCELTANEIANEAYKAMQKATIKKMIDEIMLDPLTNVYNRRYFQENEESLNNAESSNYCTVMLDIDHFKNINDTYGHDVGDKVLVFFAKKMKNEFYDPDIIMRWGGEEFVLLLNNTNQKAAIKKLNNFRKTIQNSVIQLENKTIKFTFTAGICQVRPGMTVSEAIAIADKCLYDGKTGGRNRIVYKNS